MCSRVLLKWKRDREIFWHRHQKGDGKCPPLTMHECTEVPSNTFSIPFSLFSFWNPYYAYIGTFYIIPIYLIFRFIYLFLIFHLSLWCSGSVISIILSSKSHMYSSLLFCWLFIASRVPFISEIDLSIFDWAFFVVLLSC